MQYKVKEGLTKESLVNTKWDISGWSYKQKSLWQVVMQSLSPHWKFKGHGFFDKSYYYLDTIDQISYGESSGIFTRESNEQKHFSDVFDTIGDEETSADDVLIINEEHLAKVGLSNNVDNPTKSVDTSWTDTHYDQNYILTKEDIKKGYVRLDAYTVAKVWRIGSKDDSGALWHTFKVFPRYGEKNDKEREIRAMYAQIKALAKIEGVDLN